MVSRQVHTAALLAGLFGLAIIGLTNAIPIAVETASLAPELIKRVNVKWFATTIGSLGAISYTVCAADIEPTTKAAICAIALVETVISAVAGVTRILFGRDAAGADPRLPSQLIHYYPQQNGSTTLKQLHAAFQDTSLLVAHSDCFGPGYHQVHYSNKKSASGDLIHIFSASPRHNSTANLQRRKDYSGAKRSIRWL